MRTKILGLVFAVACATAAFTACKSNEVNQSTNTTNNFMSVGPEGNTVPGPDNTMIQVPPNALTDTITMGILVAEEDEYPPLGAIKPLGKVYAFHPHGQFFLIDATITMPATTGDVDIYRAQPNGTWELFAKPKANGGLVKFRTSGLSFYAAATGTGGCVRDLDCGAGQCVDKKCTSGPVGDGGVSDGGSDGGVSDGGSDGGTCAAPAPTTKSGTVTSASSLIPKVDGVATTKSGMEGSEYVQDIRIKLGDFTNMCGYATEGRIKATSNIFYIDLYRRSTTGAPPAWASGTYNIGDSMVSGVREQVFTALDKFDASCMPGDVPQATGTVTITTVDAMRVTGSFNVTDDGWGGGTSYSGTFDVPICNTMSGATGCCVK